MYVAQFTDFETFIKVGEYNIPFPEMPPKNKIHGYKDPAHLQKIKQTMYSVGGKTMYANQMTRTVWNRMPEAQRTQVATTEWDRRWNGKWYYNNGKPIYVPGSQYYFINYYNLGGYYPDWWSSQWQIFLLLEDTFHSTDSLGVFMLKGRRGGGTAAGNSWNQDMVTRYTDAEGGFLNKTGPEAQAINFLPVVYSVNKLPAFMAPLRRGNQWPKSELEFYPPQRRESRKSHLQKDDQVADEGLHSKIDYIATSEVGYDGHKKLILCFDEIGKWKDINPNNAIRIQQLCCMDGAMKYGMIFAYSSVEEIADDQLREVGKLKEECDPATATSRWCSSNKMRRYLEPFYHGFKGYVDEWGYSNWKQADKDIEEEYQSILRKSGRKVAMDFRRKHPRNWEEALLPSSTGCVFNAHILLLAKKNIEKHNFGDGWRPVRGRLQWEIPFQKVMWIPEPDLMPDDENYQNPWFCSGHPSDAQKNNILMINGELRPGNIGALTTSVDPISYDIKDTHEQSRLSNGSFVVHREFDITMEGDPEDIYDENGDFLNFGLNFNTGRTWMHYCFRPDSAEEFYHHVAMTIVYNGSPVLIENADAGLKDFLIANGLGAFMLTKEGKFASNDTINRIGWPASKEAKEFQFGQTDIQINKLGCAERHLQVIEEELVINKENLTLHDLGAAKTIGCVASHLIGRKYSQQNPYTDKKTKTRKRKKRYVIPVGANRAKYQELRRR